MQLTLPDVVRLCGVTESQVHHWIQEEELPVQVVNNQYRFSRMELLEWATMRGIRLSPAIFTDAAGGTEERGELLDALAYGGVAYLTVPPAGADVHSLLLRAVEGMPLPREFRAEQLVELLLARHSVGTTALGEGIAIPHARYPVLLGVARPAIRLCLLSHPVDFHSPDGKPVDTLFIMVCGTVHEHLRLLAKLAGVLREESFRRFLRTRPGKEVLLEEVRRREEALVVS